MNEFTSTSLAFSTGHISKKITISVKNTLNWTHGLMPYKLVLLRLSYLNYLTGTFVDASFWLFQMYKNPLFHLSTVLKVFECYHVTGKKFRIKFHDCNFFCVR